MARRMKVRRYSHLQAISSVSHFGGSDSEELNVNQFNSAVFRHPDKGICVVGFHAKTNECQLWHYDEQAGTLQLQKLRVDPGFEGYLPRHTCSHSAVINNRLYMFWNLSANSAQVWICDVVF